MRRLTLCMLLLASGAVADADSAEQAAKVIPASIDTPRADKEIESLRRALDVAQDKLKRVRADAGRIPKKLSSFVPAGSIRGKAIGGHTVRTPNPAYAAAQARVKAATDIKDRAQRRYAVACKNREDIVTKLLSRDPSFQLQDDLPFSQVEAQYPLMTQEYEIWDCGGCYLLVFTLLPTNGRPYHQCPQPRLLNIVWYGDAVARLGAESEDIRNAQEEMLHVLGKLLRSETSVPSCEKRGLKPTQVFEVWGTDTHQFVFRWLKRPTRSSRAVGKLFRWGPNADTITETLQLGRPLQLQNAILAEPVQLRRTDLQPLFPETTKFQRDAMRAREVVNGMTKRMVVCVWGSPRDINRTVLEGRVVSEQWCYGDLFNARYLYFDNGRLTSWQD